MCQKQVLKFSGANAGYKNEVIGTLNRFLTQYPGDFRSDELSSILNQELLTSLESIASCQSMLDNFDKFTSFDEKKDEDKQILQTVKLCCNYFALCWSHIQFKDEIRQTYLKYFGHSNFLVRNYILLSVNHILTKPEHI